MRSGSAAMAAICSCQRSSRRRARSSSEGDPPDSPRFRESGRSWLSRPWCRPGSRPWFCALSSGMAKTIKGCPASRQSPMPRCSDTLPNRGLNLLCCDAIGQDQGLQSHGCR
jgi:hypothetical protein